MTDDETQRIMILMRANSENLNREIEKARQQVRKATKDMERATQGMQREMSTRSEMAGVSMANLGRAGVAAVGVLVASLAGGEMRRAIASLADLKDVADRVGLDTDSFQGLERGFQLAGVELGAFSSSMEMFTQRIGEAALGQGSLLPVLKNANIAIRDQNGEVRSTLDILKDYAELLESIPDEARRMALLNDAFGRSGRALALAFADGRDGIEDMISSAIESGYVLDSSVIDRAAEIDDRFDDLTRRASNAFKKVAVDAADAFIGAVDAAQDALDSLPDLPALPDPALAGAGATLDAGQEAALREQADAIEENREALAKLAAENRALASDAAQLSGRLLELAAAFGAIGEYDASSDVASLAREIDVLLTQFHDADGDLEDFAFQMAQLIERAQRSTTELAGIDTVTFNNVTSSLESVISVLGRALTAARSFAAALPSAAEVAAISTLPEGGPGTFPVGLNRLGNNTASDLAPTQVIRPQLPSIDASFGFGTADAGSPGGGSARSQAREIDDLRESYDRLMASLDPVIAAQQDLAQGTSTADEALAAGVISAEEHAAAIAALADEYGEATGKSEWFTDALSSGIEDFGNAFGAFLESGMEDFDAFTESLVDTFANGVADMVAEAASAQLGQALGGFAGPVGGLIGSAVGGLIGGLFGGGGGQSYEGSEQQAIDQQKADLIRRQHELLGHENYLREQEILALDKSNQALARNVQALEEQAAAAAEVAAMAEQIAAERLSLEMELASLMGDTAALREMELAQITDETNRALQEQIYAEQDRLAALDASTAAAQEAARAMEEYVASLRPEAYANLYQFQRDLALAKNGLMNPAAPVGSPAAPAVVAPTITPENDPVLVELRAMRSQQAAMAGKLASIEANIWNWQRTGLPPEREE